MESNRNRSAKPISPSPIISNDPPNYADEIPKTHLQGFGKLRDASTSTTSLLVQRTRHFEENCAHVPICQSNSINDAAKLFEEVGAVKKNLLKRQIDLKTLLAVDKRFSEETDPKDESSSLTLVGNGKMNEKSRDVQDEFLRKLSSHDFSWPTNEERLVYAKNFLNKNGQIPNMIEFSDACIITKNKHDRNSFEGAIEKLEKYLRKEMDEDLQRFQSENLKAIEIMESEHETNLQKLTNESAEFILGVQESDREMQRFRNLDSKLAKIIILLGSSYSSLRFLLLKTSKLDSALSIDDSPRFNVPLGWQHLLEVIQADKRVALYLQHVKKLRGEFLGNHDGGDEEIISLIKNLEQELNSSIQMETNRMLQLKIMGDEDRRKLYINFKKTFDIQNTYRKKALEKIYSYLYDQLTEDVTKLLDAQNKAVSDNQEFLEKYNRCIKDIEEQRKRMKEVLANMRLKLGSELAELRVEKEAEVVRYLERNRKIRRDIYPTGLKPPDTLVLM